MDNEDDVDVQDEVIHKNAHDNYDECIIDESLDDNNKNVDLLAKIPAQSNLFFGRDILVWNTLKQLRMCLLLSYKL